MRCNSSYTWKCQKSRCKRGYLREAKQVTESMTTLILATKEFKISMIRPFPFSITIKTLVNLEPSKPQETLQKFTTTSKMPLCHKLCLLLDQKLQEKLKSDPTSPKERTWTWSTSMISFNQTVLEAKVTKKLPWLWSIPSPKKSLLELFLKVSHKTTSKLNSSSETVKHHPTFSSLTALKISVKREWTKLVKVRKDMFLQVFYPKR